MADQIINVHTPSSSLAVLHTPSEDTLQTLCDKLTRKLRDKYNGARVGPGWIKYSWSNSVWNLDDESDYIIFTRRFSQPPTTPTLHVHNPREPLPTPPAYRNASYYALQPDRAGSPALHDSSKSHKSSVRSKKSEPEDGNSQVIKFKKDFNDFHGANGVRTVIGTIGPVKNVRMLLKSGYRHVYISRRFALTHGFIPPDTAPGLYGYCGLVNLGVWTITLDKTSDAGHDGPYNPHLPISSNAASPHSPPRSDRRPRKGSVKEGTRVSVYLSEEQHFDVVLGRSFLEARQIHTNPLDPTDVWCGDTGEKLVCELIVLRDGKGDIVSVT